MPHISVETDTYCECGAAGCRHESFTQLTTAATAPARTLHSEPRLRALSRVWLAAAKAANDPLSEEAVAQYLRTHRTL